MEHIHVNRGEKNIWVVVDSTNSDCVKQIFQSLHYPVVKTKFFGANIYCNPLRNTTPEKDKAVSKENKLGQSCNDSPMSNFKYIPGLSKSAQRKALKKAKNKEKVQDQKKAKLSAKDFLQKGVSDGEYDFQCIDEVSNRGQSKFFHRSPVHESTADESDSDNEALKIREPVLKPAISQEAFSGKRVLSPEEKSYIYN